MKRIFLLQATWAMVLTTVLSAGSCSRRDDPQDMPVITVGMEATAVNALIYIAAERQYFTANGLRVIISDGYASGAKAVEAMLAGHVDLATAAEGTVVRNTLEHRPIGILAAIDMFMHMKLIGRRDHAINRIPDLTGKRIGVPLNSAADFKLGRFLDLHAIDRRRVKIVDMQAPRAVEFLSTGAVDAVVAWPPYVTQLQDRLGPAAVTWSVHSGQPMYCLVLVAGRWEARHPGMVQQFLQSLLQAEDFLIQNEAQAKATIQQRLGYNDKAIATIWPEHQFSVHLDQSLILAMEDQARWIIENGLTKENKSPDFLANIHSGYLEGLRPQIVSIIRPVEETEE